MQCEKKINIILHNISKVLAEVAKRDGDPGLLTGYGGSALFFAYYYRLTGKRKHLDMVNRLAGKMIRAITEKELSPSHCSGIAGIVWGIQHLGKHDFIRLDEDAGMFDEVEEFLFDAMRHNLEQGHYDFMHLGLGPALYFLDKLPASTAARYLEHAAQQLDRRAVRLNTGISWPDRISEEMESTPASGIFNLGLSHGVPSIISILGLLYEKGIAPSVTEPLAAGGIQWLLAMKNPPNTGALSLFAKKVDAAGKPVGTPHSRLGWCYGDLGIAMSLWNTGTRMRNDTYVQEACNIFEETLKDRNSGNSNVADACLCHGSLGISHMYRRIYLSTGNDLFLSGADQWLNHTLDMVNGTTGLEGFRYKSETGYRENHSLLEGLAGIGLGLTAALDREALPAWDRCLLIS